ncbi:hypothetical protein Tsp_11413 [Trichinella spiralis]|uniref:hypothetical protein n=1 Tax=Trichinella spiralis TaxID=6334 RepID=UPI0001EFE926|nr:hypothetical protein Tsp_11413 [Trichinella spiralis]
MYSHRAKRYPKLPKHRRDLQIPFPFRTTKILIAEQGVMDTLIQQVLSGNVTVGDLRRVNRVYAQKQRRVAQYTGEYTNGRRTLEQFLEALMDITPHSI